MSVYSQVLPTSVEPAKGFAANERVVFEINHQNQQIRPKSVRLNGVLQLWRDHVGGTPVDDSDQLYLDPDAGVNGFIYQISTEFGNSNVETINDYGRWVKMKNEATYAQLDHCTSTDSMLELMTYSQDGQKGGKAKINQTLGMKFPIDATSSELPFSVDLDICVNNSVEPLPYKRTGQIKLSILTQDNTRCGMRTTVTPNTNTYCYSMKYLEVRYLADPEAEKAGAIILETKSLDHIPTLVNKYSGVQFSPSHAFDSVVCSFLKTGHDAKANDFTTYNYLETESITEQIDYLEVKINNKDNVLEYPLIKQTSEILYNYLLAWHPYIHPLTEATVSKHGLTYSKLSNHVGFGVGLHLYGGVDAGTKVAFNISLKSVPADSYRMFFYSIGKLII